MVYPISSTAPIRFRRYTVSYLENMENIYLTIRLLIPCICLHPFVPYSI
ncbi:hypothetical protein ACTPEF_25570 [Clostridioides difficile]